LQLILRQAIQDFLLIPDVCSHAANWVFMRQLSQEFDSKECCSKVLGAELKEKSFGILEYISDRIFLLPFTPDPNSIIP
jgi:hypothetical protein